MNYPPHIVQMFPEPMQWVLALEDIARHNQWTQEQLAEKLGCRFETVNRWMTGAYLPSKAYLRVIKYFCEQEAKKIIDEKK